MGYFYDPVNGGPLRLEVRSINGTDFAVLHQLGYRGAAGEFIFPDDLDRFRTDFASVPGLFTWLVPRTGDFLPAAVLHDALVSGEYIGPRVSREQADEIFRIAMDELGTGRVRSRLMWAAVSLATMFLSRSMWRRVALIGVLAVIVVLGVVSTLDLFDIWNVLPWMGDRPWYVELVTGFVAAVVIPSVLALSWGSLWLAGVIAGISLALLLHVTVVLAGLYALYRVVEYAASGRRRRDGVYPRRRRPDVR
ncbi:DUF1353 domain-containing protein [Epidermidibacterium keratini]|uniref:DUF1353 domain-containing protein n=1 Tax=Epidermidibacterium keratini TaxID=1891644 RepID=A0A7L4YNW5_9ACTN|nr:DUF1353 domain-containing protein [Epidermidibacterium keratini]QHC00836.1 DUF1353 domain-containing protein [Epidermidibacterium keratini]